MPGDRTALDPAPDNDDVVLPGVHRGETCSGIGSFLPMAAATAAMRGISSLEFVEIERLAAIGEGVIRIRMDLDHQPVRAGGDAGQGQRSHVWALAGGMAGIDENRQMRQPLQQPAPRRRSSVLRVCVLEGADAALAEDHIRVALREHVLGRQQPLFHQHRQAALEHDRFAGLADLLEQEVVLRVARADLEDVGVLVDRFDIAPGSSPR